MRKIGLVIGLVVAATLSLTACGAGGNDTRIEWYGTSLGDVMCFETGSNLECNFETLAPSLTKTDENSKQLELEWIKADGVKIPCFKEDNRRSMYMSCNWKGVQIPEGVKEPEWVKSEW
jgi:hypothetical protein